MAYLPDSQEELAELIAAAVRTAVAEAIPPAVRAATRKEYLTTDELAELTGWSPRTIYGRRRAGKLPFIQHGRTILYPTDELREHLHEGYVPKRIAV